MKRIVVILLAVLYLLGGGGLMLRQHYCMGDFVDVQMGHLPEDDHQCDRCGMKRQTGNGCCDTKVKILKAFDDQVQVKTVEVKWLPYVAFLPVNHLSPVGEWRYADALKVPVKRLQLPPPRQCPVFVAKCVWLI